LRSYALGRQIFATKSIDKLISESERPEHALKKTLGPVSLTALGIGAVIGSGIFTVIGVAIGGNPASTATWADSPVVDLLLRFIHHSGVAVGGRPGAGPALAISLVLVAIVCALTGLCYAELASMIPIAGSAYTYTYATLGELVAWVIGWDLILEYAFSNMSVSVGFAAHVVDLLDWLGLRLSPKWLSPAYLPLGLQDLQGLQHSCVSGGAAADGSAGTRNSRVGADEQHYGAGEDRGDSGLHLLRDQLYSSGQLRSVLAEWLERRAGWRIDYFLYIHWVRFGVDGERGMR
jgi:Amino acid permease